jgi:hypothetical protein
MRLEALLELRVRGFFDHVWKCFGNLLFSVVDIAQRVHEQIIHCLDVSGGDAHGYHPHFVVIVARR